MHDRVLLECSLVRLLRLVRLDTDVASLLPWGLVVLGEGLEALRVLLHDLEGMDRPRLLVLDQQNGPLATLPEELQCAEVGRLERGCAGMCRLLVDHLPWGQNLWYLRRRLHFSCFVRDMLHFDCFSKVYTLHRLLSMRRNEVFLRLEFALLRQCRGLERAMAQRW